MKKIISISVAILLIVAVFGIWKSGWLGSLSVRNAQSAATTVPLLSTTNFAVLGATTITNTGSTTITGDLGLSPGTSVTGFPPGTVIGTQHVTDATAAQAQVDLITAYNDAAGQGPINAIGTIGAGQTLYSGVYNSASSIQLNGALTLDGQGDPAAVFVFQAGSTLTTASASQVNLVNGAQACNVFWQVGSSATLGTGSDFKGSILALTSITDNGSSTISGRLLARNAAVTLDRTTISIPSCASAAVLHVIKVTKNGVKAPSDFTVYVKDNLGNNVTGSPATGASTPGSRYSFAPGTYTVSEGAISPYVQTFSGACDSNGNVTISAGESLTCTITNTDYSPTSSSGGHSGGSLPTSVSTSTPTSTPAVIATTTATTSPSFPNTGFSSKK